MFRLPSRWNWLARRVECCCTLEEWEMNMDARRKYPIAIFTLLIMSAMAWGQQPEAKRTATLAEQKMCSEQAQKVDAEWERRAECAIQPRKRQAKLMVMVATG